jgi:hypothetical protein
MKFAKYWANAQQDCTNDTGKSFQLTAAGGSNSSMAQARERARVRVEQLAQIIRQKGTLNDYEYADGYIQEEIIQELQGPDGRPIAVITRNSYGATILNTDKVLFGDIDVPRPGIVDKLLSLLGKRLKDKAHYVAEVCRFQAANPELAIVVYETHSGLRFAVTHKEIDPTATDVAKIFTALHVDKLYGKLCRAQASFRARLTPKPWRMGLPRPPFRFPREAHEKQSLFDTWLQQYTNTSVDYSTAKRIEHFGDHVMPASIRQVIELHDRIACAGGKALA